MLISYSHIICQIIIVPIMGQHTAGSIICTQDFKHYVASIYVYKGNTCAIYSTVADRILVT